MVEIPKSLKVFFADPLTIKGKGSLNKAMEVFLKRSGPDDLQISNMEAWLDDCLALTQLQVDYVRFLTKIWRETWGKFAIEGKQKRKELSISETPLVDEFSDIDGIFWDDCITGGFWLDSSKTDSIVAYVTNYSEDEGRWGGIRVGFRCYDQKGPRDLLRESGKFAAIQRIGFHVVNEDSENEEIKTAKKIPKNIEDIWYISREPIFIKKNVTSLTATDLNRLQAPIRALLDSQILSRRQRQ